MPTQTSELDRIDLEVLRQLQLDGRKSFTDLAEALEVSVGTIRNRYNRLREQNILHIIGWTDPVAAGYHAYARVNIEVRPTSKLRQVAQVLATLAEVSFLAFTSGAYDIEINLVCRDNAQLLRLMHEHIHPLEGVFQTNTTIYFEVLKWAAHDISRSQQG
ncbi:MAG: Lrp/AsnC family transcriptional regulator [Bacteroidetes bacterium]|nr:MAG: Lrp/AsnC family transcriptional regulator [Bacteroidota bacterium]